MLGLSKVGEVHATEGCVNTFHRRGLLGSAKHNGQGEQHRHDSYPCSEHNRYTLHGASWSAGHELLTQQSNIEHSGQK